MSEFTVSQATADRICRELRRSRRRVFFRCLLVVAKRFFIALRKEA